MNSSLHKAKQILDILVGELAVAQPGEIDPESNLLTEGYLDSINVMQLIKRLEEEFNVKIPPRDLVPQNFITVNAISAYLNRLAAEVRPIS